MPLILVATPVPKTRRHLFNLFLCRALFVAARLSRSWLSRLTQPAPFFWSAPAAADETTLSLSPSLSPDCSRFQGGVVGAGPSAAAAAGRSAAVPRQHHARAHPSHSCKNEVRAAWRSCASMLHVCMYIMRPRTPTHARAHAHAHAHADGACSTHCSHTAPDYFFAVGALLLLYSCVCFALLFPLPARG